MKKEKGNGYMSREVMCTAIYVSVCVSLFSLTLACNEANGGCSKLLTIFLSSLLVKELRLINWKDSQVAQIPPPSTASKPVAEEVA